MSVLAKGFADLLGRMGISPDILEGEMKKIVDGAIGEVRDHFASQGGTLADIFKVVADLHTNVASIQDHLAKTAGYIPPSVDAAVESVVTEQAALPATVEHTVGEVADSADFAAPTAEQAAVAEAAVLDGNAVAG